MKLTNLVANPSAEVDTSFWNATGGASFTRDTTAADVGAASIRVTTGTVAGTGIWQGQYAATPGTPYGFRARVRPTTSFGLIARLQFLDASLAQLSLVDGAVVTPAANTWATVSVGASAPAGAVYLRVFVTRSAAAAAGQVFYVDSLRLADATTRAFDPALYFDGDTPDTSAATYSWTDVPGLSSSVAEYLPTPAPYADDTPDLLTRSLGTVVAARIITAAGETVPLDLISGTLSYDEARRPYVEANLTCRVPTDAAQLSRIDPRTGARLELDAGYRRPGGVLDVQTIANLSLRFRRVARPADTLTLVGRSDESLLIDAANTGTGTLTAASTLAGITQVIQSVLPAVTPTVTNPEAGSALSAEQFDDRVDFLADLADRIGARVYDDGLRVWHVDPAPVLDLPTLKLATGTAGIVTDTDETLDREGDTTATAWANAVLLTHEWVDSTNVPRKVSAYRRVTSGPYTATGNTKALTVNRSSSITQAAANAAAASLVARTVTRGRSQTVGAIAAWWLRPGHTVTAPAEAGTPQAVLVSAVTFDLVDGSMDVTTRLPDNTGTIGA